MTQKNIKIFINEIYSNGPRKSYPTKKIMFTISMKFGPWIY